MDAKEKLDHLTDRNAVLAAMAEFRQLGRDEFIRIYSQNGRGFRPSNNVFVIHNGVGYDSKPLAAAAYGHQFGRENALPNEFHGGDPIRSLFRQLGFAVVEWTSPKLEEGKIYTREDLRDQFKIEDATLNNGVFQPKDTNSVWLFITKEKTSDRTQYDDHFDGDILYWQGQTAGRTDQKIIGHEADGNELLVFFRESKRQHPGAGFIYEGPFRYLNHEGSKPTNFVLQRSSSQQGIEAPESEFNPTSVIDGRKKVWAEVKRRQGQLGFRRKLLKAYGGRCAVTGTGVEPIVEAAHIRPYFGAETNVVQNGLLLRADIHTLFDIGLISVGKDHRLLVSTRLQGTEYEALAGKELMLPTSKSDYPSELALEWHLDEHGWGAE